MPNTNSVGGQTSTEAKDTINAAVMLKYSFGCTALPLDPLQSFAGINLETSNEKAVHNNRLIYAIGKNVCVHDETTGVHQFCTGKLKNMKRVTHFLMSPSQRYLVVCESSNNIPYKASKDDIEDTGKAENIACVTFYYLTNMARFKTISYSTPSDFICSVFCTNHKHLACLAGEPNRQIILFNWEKEKVHRVINLDNISVNCLRVCPSISSTLLTTSGDSCLKSWSLTPENIFKQESLVITAREAVKFIDHIWLPSSIPTDYRMIALTDLVDGREIDSSTSLNNAHSAHHSYTSLRSGSAANKQQILYIFEGKESGPNNSSFDLHQTIILSNMTDSQSQQGLGVGALLESHIFDGGPPKIEAIGGTKKGFVLVGENGYICLYEKTMEKKDSYREVRRLTLGDFVLKGVTVMIEEELLCVMTANSRLVKVSLINSQSGLSLNAATTSTQADVEVIPKSITDLKQRTFRRQGIAGTDEDFFSKRELLSSMATDLVFGGNHSFSIKAADSAKEKPLLVTISADHTARIWDYESFRCELVYSFKNDEPMSVSFHPGGNQILFGFRDKVRIYSLLIDTLFPTKEIPVKKCSEVKFSASGHLWACVSHSTLYVFDTISFQPLAVLNGHISPIRRIGWTQGDQAVVSAGMDGNVYAWPINKESRIDIVTTTNRTSNFYGLDIDSPNLCFRKPKKKEVFASITKINDADDMYTVICSSGDGYLRALPWNFDSLESPATTSSANLPSILITPDDRESHFNCLCLSFDRQFLFAGTSAGSLRIYIWPPVINKEYPHGCYIEYHLHNGSIVAIKESAFSNKIVTVGEDSNILIFEFSRHLFPKPLNEDGKLIPFKLRPLGPRIEMAHDIAEMIQLNKPQDIVYISIDELKLYIRDLVDIQRSLEESQVKLDYETRKLEIQHLEVIKRLTENHEASLNNEKRKFSEMKSDYEVKTQLLLEQIDKSQVQHVTVRSELENRYEHVLGEQMDRFDGLSEQMARIKMQTETKLKTERSEFERTLQTLHDETSVKIKQLTNDLNRTVSDRLSDTVIFKDTLNKTEAEYELKIKHLTRTAENDKNNLLDENGKLRLAISNKNMKLEQMKVKMLEMSQFSKQEAYGTKALEDDKDRLLDMININKRRAVEYEAIIAEKDKLINDLSSNNKSLETFKSVLNHNLNELSNERGPMSEYVAEMKSHITSIYEELVEEFELKKVEKDAAIKREKKILDLTADVTRFRNEAKKNEQVTRSFMRDLSNVFSTIGTKIFEDEVRKLYKKYIKNEKVELDLKSDPAIQALIQSNIQGNDDIEEENPGYSDNNMNPSLTSNKASSVVGRVKTMRAMDKKEVDKALVDAASEAERQRLYLENEIEFLKKKLYQNEQNHYIESKKKLKENSQILFDCSDLKRQVKHLEKRLQQTLSELQTTKREFTEYKSNSKKSQHLTTAETLLSSNKFIDNEFSSNFGVPERGGGGSLEFDDNLDSNSNLVLENTLPGRNLKTVTRKQLRLSTKSGSSTNNVIMDTNIQNKDFEIQRLHEELKKLSSDLDLAAHEREMQKKEISRIRTLLISNKGIAAGIASGVNLSASLPSSGASYPAVDDDSRTLSARSYSVLLPTSSVSTKGKLKSGIVNVNGIPKQSGKLTDASGLMIMPHLTKKLSDASMGNKSITSVHSKKLVEDFDDILSREQTPAIAVTVNTVQPFVLPKNNGVITLNNSNHDEGGINSYPSTGR